MSERAPRPKLKIDRKHSLDLLAGKPITIRVPMGATSLTLQCERVRESTTAEILDVFFNGRAASI
jgi:hypothetical protein